MEGRPNAQQLGEYERGRDDALQNLNKTNVELATTQNRINTGLKVSSAKDNGAIWAIAQSQRSEVSALSVVQNSLDRGKSAVDVAMAAGESISDLLIQLKEKALSAKDSSTTTAARNALNEDFKAIRDQIAKTVSNAQFNGVNLLKSGATTFKALANADGSSTIDVAAEIMKLSGTIVTVTTTDVIDTLTKATAVLTKVDASIANVSASLARMGTSSKALDTHRTFVSKLQDTLAAECCQLNSPAHSEFGARASQAAAVASTQASFAALRKVRRVSRLIR